MKRVEIWSPKYSTNECLVLARKVEKKWGMEDEYEIVFTKALHLLGRKFKMKGVDIRACKAGTNGKSKVYCIPMQQLEENEIHD